jgi:acetoacetate decarboxylase
MLYSQHIQHREELTMPRAKMVYITADGHRRLKLLAARKNRSMGKVVEELLERELADLAGAWTGPEGLLLQEAALAQVWDDPALDVYNRD